MQGGLEGFGQPEDVSKGVEKRVKDGLLWQFQPSEGPFRQHHSWDSERSV